MTRQTLSQSLLRNCGSICTIAKALGQAEETLLQQAQPGPAAGPAELQHACVSCKIISFGILLFSCFFARLIVQ